MSEQATTDAPKTPELKSPEASRQRPSLLMALPLIVTALASLRAWKMATSA